MRVLDRARAGHELPDVRARALASLRFKLQERLITVHDIVQEVPSLDTFLNTYVVSTVADDAAARTLVAQLPDACWVLATLARHPFGFHYLQQRQVIPRITALKQMLADKDGAEAAVGGLDTVLAALLSLPEVAPPARVPLWAPTLPVATPASEESLQAKAEAQRAQAAEDRRTRLASTPTTDLLLLMDRARGHDVFLDALQDFIDKCNGDASAAQSVSVLHGLDLSTLERVVRRLVANLSSFRTFDSGLRHRTVRLSLVVRVIVLLACVAVPNPVRLPRPLAALAGPVPARPAQRPHGRDLVAARPVSGVADGPVRTRGRVHEVCCVPHPGWPHALPVGPHSPLLRRQLRRRASVSGGVCCVGQGAARPAQRLLGPRDGHGQQPERRQRRGGGG